MTHAPVHFAKIGMNPYEPRGPESKQPVESKQSEQGSPTGFLSKRGLSDRLLGPAF